MAAIIFDDVLDDELSKHVPVELRGEKKTTLRAHYVAREWLRERRESEDRDETKTHVPTVGK